MTSEKLDRRKRYTRMALKESLLELLKEKSFSTITVKEICQTADINRSTFYAHFRDQHDLLEKMEDEIIMDMKDYLESYNIEQRDDALRMTEKIIEYFAAKEDELQVLLNHNGETTFERKVKEVAQQYLMNEWLESKRIDNEFPAYVSSFIISGTVQVMKIWLKDGMKQSPRTMAILINDLINHGLYGKD